MDTLDAMRVFTAVAERSGFSAAADALDRSTASVTRQVAALEQRLGTRLLNRTTRRVSLTSAGSAYYQRCLQLLADLDDLEATIGAQALEPAGVLRVNAPVSYGIERLGALLPGFRARYPQVELDLSLSDRLVDMVEEGFDVAIRITRQPAPMLIARQLGTVRIASPAYLARAGTPRHPSDLAGHECLLYHYSPTGRCRAGRARHRDAAGFSGRAASVRRAPGAHSSRIRTGRSRYLCGLHQPQPSGAEGAQLHRLPDRMHGRAGTWLSPKRCQQTCR